MNGITLASHYAFPPNEKGYCGKESFSKILREADAAQIQEELKKFKAHYAYLSLIARENGKKPFDYEVVEAFWIGNGLLEKVSHEALKTFIEKELFAGKKEQEERAKKLAAELPGGMLPHHSFNALYINFVTDAAEKTVENFDACCVTVAEVREIARNGKTARVIRNAVVLGKNGAKFAFEKKEETIELEKNGFKFVEGVSRGDLISVHWGMAMQKLTREQADAIEKYTKINMDACKI
ncbi:Uncharacterised protein [Candidatus Gugararchaeum adminiculabundum]|nr:Uncharacterised protein [Candidatus Gugararchaeum adminiculabundum]